MKRVRQLVFSIAALLLGTGCFHYVPTDVSSPPKPETEVRITLAQPMDVPMGEFTLNEVTRIEGIVTGADGDTLGVVARWLRPRVGRRYDALFASYNIPVSGIGQLEEWRVSGKRTILFAGALGVVTVVVLDAIWKVVRGDPGGDVTVPENSVAAPR
jgi:hypothetical protein